MTKNSLGSPQGTFAGTAPDVAAVLRNRASDRLRPKSAQLPCDLGLFSDEADQIDLVEMIQDPTNGE